MKHVKQLLSALLVLAVVLSLLPAGVLKASAAEALAALDIGYPTFKNTELLDEVYDLSKLGVSYSEKDIMMAIYKQDLANGGDSFYMDRILAREGVCNGNAGSNGNADGNTFLTRGRALYMTRAARPSSASAATPPIISRLAGAIWSAFSSRTPTAA